MLRTDMIRKIAQTLFYYAYNLLGKWNFGTSSESTVQFDADKKYLLVCNHQSRLDPAAALAAFPIKELVKILPIRFMTARGIYYSPLYLFLALFGSFPTRKRSKKYHAVDKAISLLRRGESVIIFPEGKRTLPGLAPHSGVSRIIDGYNGNDLDIIIIRINWHVNGFWRKATVKYELYKGPNSPQAIMDAIYAL